MDLNTHVLHFKEAKAYESTMKIKKLTCDLCKASYTKKKKIQKHLKDHVEIHSGEKPYMCEVCSAKFNQAEGSYFCLQN